MTAPTEPLKLTELGELAADNRVEAIRVGLAGTSDCATAVRLEDGRWHLVGLDSGLWDVHTLEELERFSILPVGLVARDDAAELRAAAKEHLEALAAWLKASGAEGNPIRHAAQVDFNASILALRAALAASEGSES